MWGLIKINYIINIKAMRMVALMVFLPILMTIILGASLNSVFNDDNADVLPVSKWAVSIENSNEGDQFIDFMDEFQDKLNIERIKVSPHQEQSAVRSVKMMDIDGYLVFKDNAITVYKSEHSSQSVKWLEIVFNTYLISADIIEDIAYYSTDMALIMSILDNALELGDRIETLQIKASKRPNAIGYYAIAMISLTACYSLIAFILGLNEEIRRNTLKRYLISGKSLFSFLFSKSFAISMVLLTEIIVVMLFDIFVYRIDFGGFIPCCVLLLAVTVFSLSVTQFGVTLSLFFRNYSALNVILNAIFLPVMLFVGGAYLHYYRLIAIGLGDIIVFSPVYHINKGIFDMIYLNSYEYISNFMVVAVAVALFLAAFNAVLAGYRGNSWVR